MLVDNEPGVLAKVIGLFSGRGYNIDSLTVAETDHDASLSRITIVCSGTEQVIEQIRTQLEKQVPVRHVSDLTVTGPFVDRELALVKVLAEGENESKRCALPIFSAPALLIQRLIPLFSRLQGLWARSRRFWNSCVRLV